MIKLLLDGRPVRQPISGVARYCIGLSNSLDKIQNEVNKIVFVQGDESANPDILQINGKKFISGDNYGQLRRRILNLASEYLPRLLPEIVGKSEFDIVHETYFANLGRFEAVKVCTIHDVFPIDFPKMFNPRNSFYSKRNLYRQAEESTKIIAVSKYTKDRVVALTGIDPEKIEVIGNAVDPIAVVDIGKIRPNIQHFLETECEFFFVVGNIEPRKNIKRLIDAWRLVIANHPSVKLVIAGKAVFDTENVLQYAKDSLGESLVYLGTITENEKWLLLQSMRAMVFPSLLEGYGIPVVEAYAAGKPCVFSATSALTELAFSEQQLFDPLSVNDIYLAIERCLNNGSEIVKSVQKGIDFTRENSWSGIAARTLQLYKSVV